MVKWIEREHGDTGNGFQQRQVFVHIDSPAQILPTDVIVVTHPLGLPAVIVAHVPAGKPRDSRMEVSYEILRPRPQFGIGNPAAQVGSENEPGLDPAEFGLGGQGYAYLLGRRLFFFAAAPRNKQREPEPEPENPAGSIRSHVPYVIKKIPEA
jgi:hypothetical protein